jgi:hypothetical protein
MGREVIAAQQVEYLFTPAQFFSLLFAALMIGILAAVAVQWWNDRRDEW